MRYYNYIRITLIFIPIIILSFLLYKDFNPHGYLKVSYDFCQPTPFISQFSPRGRVLDIQQNRGECTQAMVIDPVYFDVRLPQKFERATLKIWYYKKPSIPLRIGPAVNLKQWQWQLKDIVYRFSDGPWFVGSAVYDLSAVQLDKNNLRFLISAPGLDINHQQIVFQRLTIEFFKRPLNQKNFYSRLKDWAKFTNLYLLLKSF